MSDNDHEDAVRFLREQHDQIRTLFRGVAEASGEQRTETFEPLVRLLAVHETAEEVVVYPALRSQGDDGNRLADARLEEEDEAKKMLTELEKLDPGSAEFEQLFTTVRSAVESHADAEESSVFPLLADTTDPEQLERMTAALKVVEGMAPTHPHKNAPESAVGNLAVGPFVAMVDRARDLLRGITK